MNEQNFKTLAIGCFLGQLVNNERWKKCFAFVFYLFWIYLHTGGGEVLLLFFLRQEKKVFELLFMTKNAPFEPMSKEKNIKLFVPRIFIMDNCKNLCTKYLSFIRCVADSEDLTSNLSIESLQQNKIVNVIQKNVVNKCLELFGEITENKAGFKVFYDQFHKSLKLGINKDSMNINKLSDLLISSKEITSLEGYVSKMKENQKHIYITGESRANVEVLQFLEELKKIDFEVLLLVDPIDEYDVQLREYDGNKLKQDENVAYESPTKKMKDIMVDKIEKVIVSYRMVDPMCFLVT
ncbi:heat shock protein 82 [Reticulomyxa filosa]|uniref:Heat shock protein 82 n=1 Tax=Reticulomyxa filosa TaxID=46433 RepID=X6LH05_RETFI|nr:heat shock protein 82 [Reticulomyxa filosa]|eukprot:ETO00671.1 heat shock protein 82 [Reticulomyxa filosa]